MTADRDLDRLLSVWFDESAAATAAPTGLPARILARVDGASQRPGWLVRDRGRSRHDGRGHRLRGIATGRQLAVAAAVAVAVVLVGAGIVVRLSDQMVAAPPPSGVVPSLTPAPATFRPLSPGSWTVTGSMHTARSGHTATLLLDGRVLVAGGSNGDVSLASAELYDPATGIWTATGSMTEVQGGATATRLLDGRVLVTGEGRHATRPNVIESAELYDPATDSWTATGSPAMVHRNGAAVLLRDGRVLLVGGGRSAELYDPATGSWTAAAPMGTGRFEPVVLLLPDGRPLVLGGSESPAFGPLSSAEIYDPNTGTWSYTWTMKDNASAAALLADGRVLTTAGVLDLTTGWAAGMALRSTDNLQSATSLLDGRVLMLGAALSNDKVTGPAADLFDPVTGGWSAATVPTTQRWSATVTRLPDGRVLVAGGWPEAAPNSVSTSMLSSAELYNPEGGQ